MLTLSPSLSASPVNQVTLGNQSCTESAVHQSQHGLPLLALLVSVRREPHWRPKASSSAICALSSRMPGSASAANEAQHGKKPGSRSQRFTIASARCRKASQAWAPTRLVAARHDSACSRSAATDEQDRIELALARADPHSAQAQCQHSQLTHHPRHPRTLAHSASQRRNTANVAKRPPSRRRRRASHGRRRTLKEELNISATKSHALAALSVTSSRALVLLSVLRNALFVLPPSLLAVVLARQVHHRLPSGGSLHLHSLARRLNLLAEPE